MEQLNERTVLEYVEKTDLRKSILGDGKLSAQIISEGNVNLIFRICNIENGNSVILKQALPYAWRYPDFKMPVDRQRIEYETLSIESQYAPDYVPKIYFYDNKSHVLVIEDLKELKVMREALIDGEIFPKVAEHIGIFMAKTLFYTSDLYLSSGKKKEMVINFSNPVLCKVQEDLVFTQPYIDHPNNKWSKPLDEIVKKIHQDDKIRGEIFYFKELYMTKSQALIHNDLHTGSIMLNEKTTKVIDPEFAFYGPMAHDIGTYFANLAIAYAAQEAHRVEPGTRNVYREWIAESFEETWNVFQQRFLNAWEKDSNGEWPSESYRENYMLRLLKESAGFGAAEIFRRTIGMAHVHDFWTIKDENIRAKSESIALYIAINWINMWKDVEKIQDLSQVMKNSKPLI
ncbi:MULTISPECIES: S-methyl-5-thioribose kinase [Pseudothermotoga]|jgi:5-methylthioribose kinase|uniref:5-methylthioribose kinase n=1 Tax=Pseudothermotoga lettingae (strain ATCC BAA-301 / DSM 14385 / NBRC 107922 / TMO) TaxID=416591 RepID=A8F7V0_PSELT|nr:MULTISPECIES: S-methyl-5-thioribose kinase [Pseudothermotoga]ABV34234.1 5-methylthioribose kinase [Pseudothermotoga lettingae TMO]KUK21480.1 MAG: Methylthioribose kinase [Pseudothermotoga lettingae]MDI3494505.1 5-methylthioribose kinase [Pseudothermotoga sp.]MDK2884839.1 5-methylthioribose kinase [Pseudothermotoga sp.]GLI48822.1 methylthioribose kinase [Pseudothermotoga lettingae TMO]